MHGQRSSATRVDEPGEASNPTTPPASRAPLLRTGGETRPPRPLAGTPPHERRGNPTTPPASRAPLLMRGGEIKRGFRPHHPARFAGTPPHERRGNPTTPPGRWRRDAARRPCAWKA